MDIISSNARFRQRVLKYSEKHGVSATSRSYKVSRNAIYEWRKKYDGRSWKKTDLTLATHTIVTLQIKNTDV